MPTTEDMQRLDAAKSELIDAARQAGYTCFYIVLQTPDGQGYRFYPNDIGVKTHAEFH
jgi:hypothetical protein